MREATTRRRVYIDRDSSISYIYILTSFTYLIHTIYFYYIPEIHTMAGTVLEALSLFHPSQARPSSPTSSNTNSTITSDESTELSSDASIDASDTSTDDEPRLPAEIMQKIFKHAQHDHLSSLASVLRTSKLNYELAMPILYEIIHLNRDTLPGLARYMSINPTERKKEQLAKVTTLVIDDIAMMFGFKWEDDLKLFCQSIVLPNVTRVIWREDEIREMDETGPKLKTIDNSMTRKYGRKGLYPKRRPLDISEIDYKLQVALPQQFTSVLPAEEKEVIVIIPPSGQFQQIGPMMVYHVLTRPWKRLAMTSDRIMKYIYHMSGRNTLEIRHPLNSEYLVLSDLVGVNHSFNPDPDTSNATDKLRIISGFEKTVARRLCFLEPDLQQWNEYLAPALRAILMRDLGPEEMMKACLEAIGAASMGWTTRYKSIDINLEEAFLDMVTELILLLHEEGLLFVGEK
jgi:hypothetical protein